MIKLTDIEFIDFGRHIRIKQELEGNVIGLTGSNGKGKTTILQGVEFAVTGSIDTEDNDPLSEWIRRGTRGGTAAKNAQVKLGFVTDAGKKGRIDRKITKTTTSRELTLEGMDDGPFSADKKVQQIMLDLLGVDKRALGSTVFIKQGAIDAMFGGKTDRREFYTRLLMLGHLPKIAEVVDGYRKNVASSIVDLSAVLDEAQNAMNLATVEFTTHDAQLAAATDLTELINMASRLVFLFGDQEAAHTAVTAELTRLGSDPATKIEALETALETARTRLKEISHGRLQHSRAQAQWLESKNRVTAAKALRERQDEHQAASDELKAKQALNHDAVNHTEVADQLQRKLDARIIIDGFTDVEQGKAFDVDLLKAQMDGATSMVNEAQTEYDKTMKVVDGLAADLDLRKTIMAELQTEHSCDARCLVCGASEAAMEEGYMTASMAELQRKLDEATPVCETAFANLQAARDGLRAAASAHSTGLSELSALRQRLEAARTTLAGDTSDRQVLTRQIAEARAKAAEQANLVAEIQRLHNDVTRLALIIGDQPYQTDNKIHEVESFEAVDKAAVGVWNTEWDTEEQTLTARLTSDTVELTALQAAQSRLKTARAWEARTQEELELTCMKHAPNLPEEIYPRGMVMTASIADNAVTKLKAEQSEYDRLRGARDAARTAMTQAQGRVIETESKIEGQRQRLDLVARLERLRDAFKPTGVTMEYLDYKFAQVAAVASDYLAESGADFTVVASERKPLSYDFIRMAPGEEWLQQSRLSGGQKVRLAVATLRAIHSLVVPNVGLLVLDEPTTHLDMDAKLALADMLRRIGDEGGLQILVCDHDPVILDACSSVIEIPE